MTPSEFVAFCKEMRELGALTIETSGFKASFPAQAHLPTRKVNPLLEPVGPDPIEARRRARREELGL